MYRVSVLSVWSEYVECIELVYSVSVLSEHVECTE